MQRDIAPPGFDAKCDQAIVVIGLTMGTLFVVRLV
jgi:hypothetical protein